MVAATRPARRYRVRFFFVPVGAIIFAAVFLVRSCIVPAPVTGDFRDPAVLSRAVEVAAQRAGDGTPISASCVETVFPDYVCSVAFYGGNIATYNVQVATDGSSWQTM